MCTVVNGGTRYKATLLDSVVDFYTGEVVFDNKPQVLSTVDLPSDTVSVLKSAMKSVVDEGTASSVFIGYDHGVGGKTGTAQVGKGSDTVLFVGFAPYDDPEIVVSVVIEHGEQSSRATSVAKAVFDYYFETKGDAE
jgi:penicillin-binding protein 2